MGRYTGPACKLCRRERTRLFLKGERCMTDRCSFSRRAYPPGEHGRGRVRETDYMLQLREKQKTRRTYGLGEKQFRGHYRKAQKQKGRTGENLIRILESRLDNVVYRAGFALSRKHARQLVSHGHIAVDGKKVNIPSYPVKVGQTVSVVEKSRGIPAIREASETFQREPVAWLSSDRKNLIATVVDIPAPVCVDVPIKEEMVVELYSR
ncbi:MAG: 30S ribosomal protein S4 [Actinomycetota bacterium]|nr:30S ribosomal protein S4 [Actinomycetota bacterium]